MSKPYAPSIFTLLLIKQIFEKKIIEGRHQKLDADWAIQELALSACFFSRKKTNREDWRYGISKGIDGIAGGFSRGELKTT